MIPDVHAVVDALTCVGCGRTMPMTRVRPPKGDRRQLNKALRAARRFKMVREAQRGG